MSEQLTPRQANEYSARSVLKYNRSVHAQDLAHSFANYSKTEADKHSEQLATIDDWYDRHVEAFGNDAKSKDDLRQDIASDINMYTEDYTDRLQEQSRHKEIGAEVIKAAAAHYQANQDAYYKAGVAEAMLDGVEINTGDQHLHAQNVIVQQPAEVAQQISIHVPEHVSQ